MVVVGVIGGSGLLKSKLPALNALREEIVDTPAGRVFLRCGMLPADAGELVFIQRHDASPSRTYTQPSDINYAAVAWALKKKECDIVLGVCSVGALKASMPLGSIVVPDDFYCPADLRRVFSDARAHLLPSYHEGLRTAILSVLRAAGMHPITHGTYVNSHGPRFETKAEIRVMAQAGELIGMTGAHECVACAELSLPYASVCMVDNYANGVSSGLMSLEEFHSLQALNLSTVEKMVSALLTNITAEAPVLEITRLNAVAPPAGAGADSSSAHAASDSHDGSTPLPTPVPESPAVAIHVDTLLHARWVVPMAAGRETQVLDHHSVAVLGGRIIDVLPTRFAVKRYTATKTVTLDESHAVMPGLVNAHTHLALNLLRGVADDMPLAQWLTEQIWPTEARLVSPDFCRAGAEAAIAELIRSGVTTINEMYWFPGATAEVVHAAGIRAAIGMTLMEFPTSYGGNATEYIERGMAIRDEWLAKSPDRIRFTLAPHAPYTVSDDTFERVRDLSKKLDVRVHLHLHETAGEVHQSITGDEGSVRHLSSERMSPVKNLHRMGVLNERLIAVHMTQLTDEEIELVAASKTSVVHCPNSNMKLASGFCPVAKLLAAGVNVAIGTDSASSNNSLDFFGEMKMAAVLAKGVASDATCVPAWQALRMATLNGALALGMESDIGSLEVGKAADMIAVDLHGIDQLPVFNVLSHLVYATSRSCVTDVWVAGSQLLQSRELLTMSEDKVRADIRKWAELVRPGATAEDKHTRLAAADTKHIHTAEHGVAEAGKVHTAGDHHAHAH